MDEDPVAGDERLVLQQADVHRALDALDADHRQVLAIGEDLDDLTGDPQAHAYRPYIERILRYRFASGVWLAATATADHESRPPAAT